jgi:hypothetical protein
MADKNKNQRPQFAEQSANLKRVLLNCPNPAPVYIEVI